MATHPRLIFGAASFGMNYSTPEEVQSLLDLLKSHGITHLDTAGRYPPGNPGRSEELIGEVKAVSQGFTVDTKILAGAGDGSGELTEEQIEASIKTSLARIGVEKVNTLHIHRPDPQTPLEEQAKAFNTVFKEGKFQTLGVSNFRPETLKSFLEICEKNNYVKPSIYQGDYSAVNRGMEKLLLPIMREHGMVYNAFRSLASGFLSGSLTKGAAGGTRFDGDSPMNQFMRNLYSDDKLHAALHKLEEATTALGITTVEAALRWACYHSALTAEDGIILGASKVSQLISNMESIGRGPLPKDIVEVLEGIWTELEPARGDIL